VRDYDHSWSLTLTRGMDRRRLRPGGRPSLYADLRTAVAHASGEPPVKPEQLARLTWKKALTLLGAFAVIYLLLPQLANAGAAVRALQHARWWWVLAAVPALFVAQAFSTLLQLGAISARLPFGPTYVVSFAGSFLNRVTPNNVGGMALNFGYQQAAGVDSGAASASVGLQTVIGLAANLLLLAVFFARTGRHTSVHFSVHIHQWVLVLITGALVGCALFGLTPRGRRFYHDKIWTFIRSAGTAIAEVAKSPRHLTLIGVGALGGRKSWRSGCACMPLAAVSPSSKSGPSIWAATSWPAPPPCPVAWAPWRPRWSPACPLLECQSGPPHPQY
jgi:glycosyltransferase 2 family protein